MNNRKPNKWQQSSMEKSVTSINWNDLLKNSFFSTQEPKIEGSQQQKNYFSSTISIKCQKDNTIQVNDNGKTTTYSGRKATLDNETDELFIDDNPTPVDILDPHKHSTKIEPVIFNRGSDSDSDSDSDNDNAKEAPQWKQYKQVNAKNIHSFQNVVISHNGTIEIIPEATHIRKPS